MVLTMLFLLTVSLSVFFSSSASLLDDYVHFAALDPAERIKLYWTIHQSNKSVSFALEAATTGWVGFGISSGSGMMKGADIVIGWVKNGKPFLTDRYAEGEYMPEIDEHNDYHLVSGEETNGTTILKFYRKIDTCDPKDRKLKEGTTKVVFALNDEDPEYPTKLKRHTFRGARSILLMNSQGNRNKPDPSWSSFEIIKNNYEVPTNDTTYHCSVHKIPDFAQKNHIVRYDPLIQKGNEGVVHHLIIMACDKDFPGVHNNFSIACNDRANMPASVLKCRKRGIMVGGWAVGGGPFVYPQHVGLPMGSNYTGKYFVLEIHFDNPDHKEGIRDNSGVRFYYTSKLRQYDAGILVVGNAVSSWHMIPPQQKAWLTRGSCAKTCTETYLRNTSLPEKGIKIFSSALHTHLGGRALWTQHVRDGVELPEIARDDTYDFNFQDVNFLPKEVHFQPGDELIYNCVYNTMDRTRLTYGGQSTREEMCLHYLYYYPYIPEMPPHCRGLDLKAGGTMLDKHYPTALKKNTSRFYNPIRESHIIWTPEMTKEYREMIEEENRIFMPHCGNNNKKLHRNITFHDLIGDKYRNIKVKITTPLPDSKEECDTDVPSSATRTSVYLLYEILMIAFIVIMG